MIFVVGTGRCGTVTFDRMLKAVGVDSHHELDNTPLWVESVKYCSMYPICPSYSEGWLRAILTGFPAEAHVNHYFSTIIPLLAQLYDDAKFVWLTREARPCVESMRRCQNWLNRGAPWERWKTIGPWMGEMSIERWNSLTKVGKCAWDYAWTNRRIAETLPEGRWMKFALEDFRDDAKRRAVFEWLATPKIPLEVPRENASGEHHLLPREWTEQEEAEFKEFCECSLRQKNDKN